MKDGRKNPSIAVRLEARKNGRGGVAPYPSNLPFLPSDHSLQIIPYFCINILRVAEKSPAVRV